MRKCIYFVSVLMISSLMFVGCSSEGNQQQGSSVFIENTRVFEEFEMKKDYDLKIEKELQVEKNQVDSLASILSQSSDKDSLTIYAIRREYYVAEQAFNQKFEELSVQYTNEVNTRLNGYIKLFSEEKGYDFIFGASGQGNIMFVKDELNVTEDLINYINKKYDK